MPGSNLHNGSDRCTAIISDQAVKIGDNWRHLRIRQRRVQLGPRHFANRIIKRWCAAVVKVLGRRRNIAQAWHAQNCRIGRRQWMKYAVALEQVAADIDALMAGDAAQGFEQPVSVQFLGRQRSGHLRRASDGSGCPASPAFSENL